MEQREKGIFILKNFLYFVTLLLFFILGEIPLLNPLYVKCLPACAVVVAVAMAEGDLSGAVFGFILGLMTDTYAAHIFGLASAVFAILGFVCGFLVHYLLQENIRTAVILTLGFTSVYSVISYYVIYAMWDFEGAYYMFFLHTLPTVFVSALFAFPAVYAVRKIKVKTEEGGV